MAQSGLSPRDKRHLSEPRTLIKIAGDESVNIKGLQYPNSSVQSKSALEGANIMWTYYDLQTNSSVMPRVYRYDDETAAGVATWSHETTTSFPDRGAGYNYYDGSNWGPSPSARVESQRTGWPSYAPLGPNGEIVVSHDGSGNLPLYVNKRDTKGTGAWTQTVIPNPAGAVGMLWCSIVTSGPDRMNVHVIALTTPTGYGSGGPWNGMEGALLYNRSTDGAVTWDGWIQLDGMTSNEYLGFGGDDYNFAEPFGETLCFSVGGFNDSFIMKSTDNGDTWTKTIIWENPYNLWTDTDPSTDTIICSDGSIAVQLDQSGKAHVLFGLLWMAGINGTGVVYWANTDGLVYWNEDKPQLPDPLDWDWLYDNGYMIGWVLDSNVWTSIENTAGDSIAGYSVSLTSHPSMVIDESNQIFAFWSGVTNLRDNDHYYLRHIFARASVDGGNTWRDTIVDLTNGYLQKWTEFVFPCVAQSSTDMIYYIRQEDDYAGDWVQSLSSSTYQGQNSASQNDIVYNAVAKADIILWPTAINEKTEATFTITQNYPNPVTARSVITINLTQPGNLSMAISNVVGQQVMKLEKGNVNTGNQQFIIDGSALPAGIYFYTVTVNKQSITKRMIVE